MKKKELIVIAHFCNHSIKSDFSSLEEFFNDSLWKLQFFLKVRVVLLFFSYY